ncbi:hypothetical protein GCM10007939_02830 [Amylibacter marinus]|uniref:Bacterial sugar transferase domain-containing protein n=1 Tax=Amylibacter marinus TaxID=1475483 RepID=A0ABQ5VRR9_9RHOB|nr:sugar transferase [Amylibacter marinus]GLQ34000.1 hypothetical protein GCM10007939_02830 [Amylibacter marinus]
MSFIQFDLVHPDTQTKERPQTLYLKGGKRLLDLILALALLPLLLPIIFGLALCISPNPRRALFGHRRLGRMGQEFFCYKLRTMVMDADQKLLEALQNDPDARREWAQTHKLKNDPRITKIGRFLRKTSLDELPQIFNVIKGDMSFVGPRPITLEEVEHYGKDLTSYLTLRPGITGLWQVNGRNDISYQSRVRLDVSYRGKASALSDIWLMIRTVGVIFNGTGH